MEISSSPRINKLAVTMNNLPRTSYQRFNLMMNNEASQRVQGQRIFNQADLVPKASVSPQRIHEESKSVNNKNYKGKCIKYNFE